MKKSDIAVVAVGFLTALTATGNRVVAANALDLKPMVMKYWSAWEKGPDAAALLYAKDANLVFYDLEPLKYAG